VESIRIGRIPPTYRPSLSNVHDVTVNCGSRVNNMCEAWSRGLSTLVGHAHPTIWTPIQSPRKEISAVERTLLLSDIGQLPEKRVRRHTKQLQEQLVTMCKQYMLLHKPLHQAQVKILE
ncbi:hypothetical protein LSH36_326g04020, partial [Paralvinella palmiformis]